MHTISTEGEVIDYERDPSNESEANIQFMFSKLDSYNEVNKTKKPLLKKAKQQQNRFDFEKEKLNEAENISNILKKVRKNNIIQEFVNKLKMNITLRNLKAEDENEYFSIGKTSLEEDFRRKIREFKIHKVIQSETFEIIVIILKFFIIFGIFYINTLKLAFDEVDILDQIMRVLTIISICIFAIEYGGMAYTIHQNRIDFWSNFVYWADKDHFIWSMIMNLGLLLELAHFPFIAHTIIILVTPEMLIRIKKLKKVEVRFVLSINFERYWELLKIVLFNFFFAHILSILLNLMGSIEVENENSWYTQKGIQAEDSWLIKYIWGCYWGTNIMLTVGFGDINAENHIEAAILIFIETIACMIMAYNVSEVSRILTNISEIDEERKFKFKVFNQMSQKYNFEDEFKTNIINHIDKSIEKKHELNYIEESLIDQLPEKIKLEVKREVNKNVFESAYFFKNLTRKTQNLLAEKVNKIFAHPEEIILKNSETWKIFILRQGNVAITFKKGSSVNNGTIIEQFFVDEIKNPELLSLKFIRKIQIKGDLKSLDFSILNMLEIEHFEKILKEHDTPMFEYYCSERDKTQYHQFDLEIRKCGICSKLKHDKFECPRMHFVPLREHVIHKKGIFSYGEKVRRNEVYVERKKIRQNPFKIYQESGQEDVFGKKQLKQYTDIIISSFQGIYQTPAENSELTKKIDKCLQKIDEGLKVMKGIVDVEELEIDSACNFKRYFPQQNPDNLMLYLREPLKRSKKIHSENKCNYVIL